VLDLHAALFENISVSADVSLLAKQIASEMPSTLFHWFAIAEHALAFSK
jgi:hypothetical protein